MPKPDPAHKETDKILRDMEKRLDEVYNQAYKEARQTADDFMKSFREMDKKKRQQVKDGELDKAEYDRWRRTQVFQGNRYHQMADTLASDMTHTNQIAASVINGYLPEVYAVNHNYGTYEIEKGSRINTQYTMYDRQTVERLIRDNPDLLPRKAAVNVPKDQLWNKKHINSAITQGILQGEAIDKIAQRLAATVTDMSHTSAIRNARTMTTSAQNGGRIDSYKRAEGMGIKILQQWMATLDDRTRHEHRQLDGQKRKVGEAFEVEGEKIFFPGDPAAEPYLTYNCRCTLIGEVEGVDYNLSDKSQRDNKLGDMTYEEWKEEKRKQDNAEPPAPKPAPKPKTEDKPAEVEAPAPTVEKPDAVDEAIPQREEFKPASTIEEAEQFIMQYMDFDQFGALREVNYKGIDLDAANEINATISRLYNEFNVDKFGGIVAPAKNTKLGKAIDEAVAGYMPMRNSFVLNKSALKSVKIAEKGFAEENKLMKDMLEHPEKYDFNKLSRAARTVIENSKISGRGTVPDNITEALTHEFGHALEKQVKKHELWDKVEKDMQTYAPKISGYATTQKGEYIAESFASWQKGEKFADPNLIKIFESLRRK
jgi:SPP1 gp7 family putative phage head morphogenesis protein